MQYQEADDEYSFMVPGPFAPLAEHVFHIDHDSHLQCTVVERGLDMNIMKIKQMKDPLKATFGSEKQEQPIASLVDLASEKQTSRGGRIGFQSSVNLHSIAERDENVDNNLMSSDDVDKSHVEISFEEPICALLSPLMMQSACSYLDQCSRHWSSLHPGNVLLNLHKKSVSSAKKFLTLSGEEEAKLEAKQRQENRNDKRDNVETKDNFSLFASAKRDSSSSKFTSKNMNFNFIIKISEVCLNETLHFISFKALSGDVIGLLLVFD